MRFIKICYLNTVTCLPILHRVYVSKTKSSILLTNMRRAHIALQQLPTVSRLVILESGTILQDLSLLRPRASASTASSLSRNCRVQSNLTKNCFFQELPTMWQLSQHSPSWALSLLLHTCNTRHPVFPPCSADMPRVFRNSTPDNRVIFYFHISTPLQFDKEESAERYRIHDLFAIVRQRR